MVYCLECYQESTVSILMYYEFFKIAKFLCIINKEHALDLSFLSLGVRYSRARVQCHFISALLNLYAPLLDIPCCVVVFIWC